VNKMEQKHDNKTYGLVTPVPVSTSVCTMLLFRAGFVVLFLYLLKVGYYLPSFFLFLLILMLETAALWSKLGIQKIQVETKMNINRLFPDDEIDLTLVFCNKKRLPVFLSWYLTLTPEFELLTDQEAALNGEIKGRAYLGSYQIKEMHYRITIKKRGYYQIPALYVYSSDFWGLFFRQKIIEEKNRLIVYPKLLPLEEIEMKPADFSGLKQDKRPFLFDPIMFAGLRDYTPDMPMRSIHWKASAHQDRLLAKIIEPSASLQILITIDAQSFFSLDGVNQAIMEKALSVAATLAVGADSQKIPFGIVANLSMKEKTGPIFVPVNRTLDQGRLVLESLARAELAQLGNIEELLKDMAVSLPFGTILILIQKEPRYIALPSRFCQVISYPLTED